MNLPKSRIAGYLIILCVGLLLAGCATAAPAVPTSGETSSASDAATPPWSSRVFTLTYIRIPQQIDPHGPGLSTTDGIALNTFYEPLARLSVESGQIEGILATGWDISDDLTTYTFHLREGVLFHDGTSLTADVVARNLERIQRLGGTRGTFLRHMASAEALDDLTVQVNLDAPDAVFLNKLAELYIASGDALAAHGDDDWLMTNEAGTGAYKLDSFTPGGDLLTFSPFPEYWKGWESTGEGAHLGTVEWRLVPESPTQRLMTESGESNFMMYFPVAFYFAAQQNPNLNAMSFDSNRVSYLPLNVSYGPLSDVRLREMLKYAFPYDALVDDYYQGLATKAFGPLHSSMIEDPELEEPVQDLERAAALLADAGYAPGELKLVFVHPAGQDEQKQPGIILQDALRQIGVELDVQAVPWASIVELVGGGPETTPDILQLINGPVISEPGIGLLESLFHSINAGNYYNWGHYINPEFDALLEQAQTTADSEARSDIYREAQRVLVDDVAGIFLAHPKFQAITTADVGGYWSYPFGAGFIPWYDLYFEQ